MKEQIEEWKSKHNNLKKEMADLHSIMEKEVGSLACAGGLFLEVGKRQQQRKLKELGTKSEKALWFATTFGLMPASLEYRVNGTNEKVTVHFNANGVVTKTSRQKMRDTGVPVTSEQSVRPGEKRTNEDKFDYLPQTEKEKVMAILCLLDHFDGSDSLYHDSRS